MTISREEVQELIAEGKKLAAEGKELLKQLPNEEPLTCNVTHCNDDDLDIYDVFTTVQGKYLNLWVEDNPIEMPSEHLTKQISILFSLEPEQLRNLHKQITELLAQRNQ